MINLGRMLDPKNIAFICSDEVEGPAERAVMANLTGPGMRRVFPVNPNRKRVFDRDTCRSVSDISEQIDLAVVMVPYTALLETCEECAKNPVGGLVLMRAGRKAPSDQREVIMSGLDRLKNLYGVRIIGPGSSGIILPNGGLNASLLTDPRPGGTAFISQGGTLANAVFYWGVSNNIGFSMFVSLGSMVDVDFADIIDVIQEDYFTKNIMLYMEHIPDARKFLSASRFFARNKPIVVLKPGRYPQSAAALVRHAGREVGNDTVYDAAFRRAGIVRARETEDYFDTARILTSRTLPRGPKLAIITNSGGLGIIACDIIAEQGGRLASFSEKTLADLKEAMPGVTPIANPVDLSGDADTRKYCDSMEACMKDAEVDGILVMYAPAICCDPGEMGKELAKLAQRTGKTVVAVCTGGDYSREGALALRDAGIPVYDTPEDAVRGYMYMVRYRRNIELLNETPEELPEDKRRLSHHLRAIIRNAVKDGKEFIEGVNAHSFLQNYGIPIFKTVREAGQEEAHPVGEWALRSMRDTDFGTFILLLSMDSRTEAGTKGFSVGLPPLNQVLARQLMEEAQFPLSHKAAAPGMENLIVRFSDLAADFPEIKEIEIETSIMPDNMIYARTATISIDTAYKKGIIQHPHLAIMPYPSRYVSQWTLRDGRPVSIQPIRAEDEPLLKEMMSGLSEETLRVRFFVVPTEITHMMLMKFCNVDYDREMAIVLELTEGGKKTIIGGGRLIIEPDTEIGQFALLISDSYQRQGIGEKLLDVLIGIAQDRALREIYGIVLSENAKMLGLASRMGFKPQRLPDGITRVSLNLE